MEQKRKREAAVSENKELLANELLMPHFNKLLEVFEKAYYCSTGTIFIESLDFEWVKNLDDGLVSRFANLRNRNVKKYTKCSGVNGLWLAIFLFFRNKPILLQKILEIPSEKFSELNFNACPDDPENRFYNETIVWSACVLALRGEGDLLQKIIISLPFDTFSKINFNVTPRYNALFKGYTILFMAIALFNKFPSLLEKILVLPSAQFDQLNFNIAPSQESCRDNAKSIFFCASDLAQNGKSQLLGKILDLPKNIFNNLEFNAIPCHEENKNKGVSVLWNIFHLALKGKPSFLNKFLKQASDSTFAKINWEAAPASSRHQYQGITLKLLLNSLSGTLKQEVEGRIKEFNTVVLSASNFDVQTSRSASTDTNNLREHFEMLLTICEKCSSFDMTVEEEIQLIESINLQWIDKLCSNELFDYAKFRHTSLGEDSIGSGITGLWLAIFLFIREKPTLLNRMILEIPIEKFSILDINAAPKHPFNKFQNMTIIWLASWLAVRKNCDLLDKIVNRPSSKEFSKIDFALFPTYPNNLNGNSSREIYLLQNQTVFLLACILAEMDLYDLLDIIIDSIPDDIFSKIDFNIAITNQNNFYQGCTILWLALSLSHVYPKLLEKIILLPSTQFDVLDFNAAPRDNNNINKDKSVLFLAFRKEYKCKKEFLGRIRALPLPQLIKLNFNAAPSYDITIPLYVFTIAVEKNIFGLLEILNFMPDVVFNQLDFNAAFPKNHPGEGISVLWYACRLAEIRAVVLLKKILALPNDAFNALNFNSAPINDGRIDKNYSVLMWACELANNGMEIHFLERILSLPSNKFNQLNFNISLKKELNQQIETSPLYRLFHLAVFCGKPLYLRQFLQTVSDEFFSEINWNLSPVRNQNTLKKLVSYLPEDVKNLIEDRMKRLESAKPHAVSSTNQTFFTEPPRPSESTVNLTNTAPPGLKSAATPGT